MPPSRPKVLSVAPILAVPLGKATENLLGGPSPLGPSEHSHHQCQASTSEFASPHFQHVTLLLTPLFPRVMSTPWAFEEPSGTNPRAVLGLRSSPLVLRTCCHAVGYDCLSLLPSPSRASTLQTVTLAALATGQRIRPGMTTRSWQKANMTELEGRVFRDKCWCSVGLQKPCTIPEHIISSAFHSAIH